MAKRNNRVRKKGVGMRSQLKVRKSFLLALVIVLFFACLTLMNRKLGCIDDAKSTYIKPILKDGLYRSTLVQKKDWTFTVNIKGYGNVKFGFNGATPDDIIGSVFERTNCKRVLIVIDGGEVWGWKWVDRFAGEKE